MWVARPEEEQGQDENKVEDVEEIGIPATLYPWLKGVHVTCRRTSVQTSNWR
jgi:hypothetical protein